MKNKKVLLTITLLLLISLACVFNVFAHKGRTDGNGGHRDNNNVSGLGSYHYHCGGYPAHLHRNGVCPYTTPSSSSSSSSNSSSYTSEYDEGYDDGYDYGYDKGYDEGHEDGYNKGYDDGYDRGYDAGYKDVSAEREKETKILIAVALLLLVITTLVALIKKFKK